jgi:hypothetical protein
VSSFSSAPGPRIRIDSDNGPGCLTIVPVGCHVAGQPDASTASGKSLNFFLRGPARISHRDRGCWRRARVSGRRAGRSQESERSSGPFACGAGLAQPSPGRDKVVAAASRLRTCACASASRRAGHARTSQGRDRQRLITHCLQRGALPGTNEIGTKASDRGRRASNTEGLTAGAPAPR